MVTKSSTPPNRTAASDILLSVVSEHNLLRVHKFLHVMPIRYCVLVFANQSVNPSVFGVRLQKSIKMGYTFVAPTYSLSESPSGFEYLLGSETVGPLGPPVGLGRIR